MSEACLPSEGASVAPSVDPSVTGYAPDVAPPHMSSKRRSLAQAPDGLHDLRSQRARERQASRAPRGRVILSGSAHLALRGGRHPHFRTRLHLRGNRITAGDCHRQTDDLARTTRADWGMCVFPILERVV